MVFHDKMMLFHLLALALLSHSYGEQYIVTPNNTTQCPLNGSTCFTLNDHISNQNSVFSSNSFVRFLPGIHRISNTDNNSFFIRDVQNVTLTGEAGELCEIVCDDPLAFVFMNVTQLTISHLTFTNCSDRTTQHLIDEALKLLAQTIYIFDPLESVSLFLVHIIDLDMDHVTIQNNTGIGLLGFNLIGESLISNSNFRFNNYIAHTACRIPYSAVDKCFGGALFIGFTDTPDCNEGRQPLYTFNITSCFVGYGTNLLRDSIGSGLLVILSQSSYGVDVLIDRITALYNTATVGANIALREYGVTDNSSITINNGVSAFSNPQIKSSTFAILSRSFYSGGGLFYSYGRAVPTSFGENGLCLSTSKRYKTQLLSVINTSFVGNRANVGPGAYVEFLRVQNGDFIAQFTFNNCSFIDNTGSPGSALFLTQLEPIETLHIAQFFLSNCVFRRNSYPESFIDSDQEVEFDILNTVFLNFIQDVIFEDCIFSENTGTAIYSYSARMRFLGDTLFERNTGINGGGLAFHGNSLMRLPSNTTLTFRENRAQRGGAIYVANQNYRLRLLCFWQIDQSNLEEFGIPIERNLPGSNNSETVSVSDALDIHLKFYGNTADTAGSALYGGSVDRCLLIFTVNHREFNSGQIFDNLFVFENQTSVEVTNTSTSLISSEPSRVCICVNNVPDCSKTQYNVSIFPGQTFNVNVITVGQRNNISPGIVFANLKYAHVHRSSRIDDLTSSLGRNQESQLSGTSCTNLQYTVYSTQPSLSLVLTSENSVLEVTTTHVSISLKSCPLGFDLSSSPPVCECNSLLAERQLECHIDNQTISRVRPLWIGKDHRVNNVSDLRVVLHDFCPFDYCVPKSFELNLEEQDLQCGSNRTGAICGMCSPGLSVILGSNYCRSCSNFYLFLIGIFALIGLLLVFALYFCNTLTVSVGIINGLIFYANIIQINKELFFPPGHYNLLTVFIAWLNLDLGIQTCFYDGMDTYAKTWLQFVFPLYILSILAVIILLSHYSSSVSKLFSKNAVPVLATILLLLFSKVQRIMINCLSYTTLYYEDGTSTVWLFDGNIPYLQGKHIFLAIAGYLLIFLVLSPFVLILLFSRFLQALSTYRLFHWVNKLKPLFDAYMGPYKDNYRYWTGLLLFVRGVLFLIYSFNVLYGPNVILLTTAITTQLLSIFTWFSGGVYKKWPLNALEFSFFLNLSILSTATLYVRNASTYQEPVIYTSVTIALFEFVGIIIYSVYHKVSESANGDIAFWSKLKERTQKIIPSSWTLKKKDDEGTPDHEPKRKVTSSSVDLPELQSDRFELSVMSDESDERFTELREPLMESL